MTATRKATLVAWALTFSAVVAVAAAFAQTGQGYLDGGTIGAGVTLPGGGSGGGGAGYVPVGTGGTTTGSSWSGSAPTATWVRHYYGSDPGGGFGLNAPFSCPQGSGAYQDVLVDNGTGETLDTVSGCSAVAQPGQPAVAPPPTPQPPPTPDEARNLVALPAPGLGLAPTGPALTGLPVWLWDSSDHGVRTATATIRGYVTTTTARPTRWTWEMTLAGPTSRSNPPGTVSANRPGTADSPAATYQYETVGSYQIRLSVEWTGSYTFTGTSGVAITRPLGTSTRTTTRSYPVTEVRPVLVSR